ncbi:MAG: hypothetical protein V3T14_01310, partial [Myxococcota bacterium]
MRAVGRTGFVATVWAVLVLCAPGPVGATHGGTDEILLVTFDNTDENNDATLVHQILSGFTYNVTHLYNPLAGAIETALLNDPYDQVWVFDATSVPQISEGDALSIAGWYRANAEGNIILDSRSYGVFFTPDDEVPIIENYAHAFSVHCGGLWLGTDHGSLFANNANAILNILEYPVVGPLQGNVVRTTPVQGHELLNVPNVIPLNSIYVNNTPARLEVGLQQDGTELLVLLDNLLLGGAPLITFALEGECDAPDTDGDGIPDSGTGAPCQSGQRENCDDNCPFEPNNGQSDADGNGRGDLCECGNVNGDASLDIFDALAIAQGTLQPPIAELPHPRACDVDNNGMCDIFDALAVAQATLQPPLT